MRHPEGTRKIARVISKLLHPYVCLPIVVALIAYWANGVSVKWAIAALLPAYLIPVLYLYRQAEFVSDTRASNTRVTVAYIPQFLRGHPNEMSIGACLFGISSVPLLYFLGSPPGIIATMVAVTITMLLVTQVNRIYRASFHLAFLTSMAVSLGVIISLPWLSIAPFIVLLGLSRYHLGHHTPAQLVVALLVGLTVTIPILKGFGFL